jgi:hypothetical protein
MEEQEGYTPTAHVKDRDTSHSAWVDSGTPRSPPGIFIFREFSVRVPNCRKSLGSLTLLRD